MLCYLSLINCSLVILPDGIFPGRALYDGIPMPIAIIVSLSFEWGKKNSVTASS